MTGVNDLKARFAELWQNRQDQWRKGASMHMQGQADAFDIAEGMVGEVARTAWHPVSEPPTEADGDGHGQVLVIDPYGEVCHTYWGNATFGYVRGWARIRDVVLLPQSTGDEA